jgi:hypothetical protein
VIVLFSTSCTRLAPPFFTVGGVHLLQKRGACRNAHAVAIRRLHGESRWSLLAILSGSLVKRLPSWRPPTFRAMSKEASLQVPKDATITAHDYWAHLGATFDMGDSSQPPQGPPRRSARSNSTNSPNNLPGLHEQHHNAPVRNYFLSVCCLLGLIPRIQPTINYNAFPGSGPPSFEAVASALRTLQDALPYLPHNALTPLQSAHQQQQQQQQQRQQQPILSYPGTEAQFAQHHPLSGHPVPWPSLQSPMGSSSVQLPPPFDFAPPPPHVPSLQSHSPVTPALRAQPFASTSSAAVAAADNTSDMAAESSINADPELNVTEDKRRRNTAASGKPICIYFKTFLFVCCKFANPRVPLSILLPPCFSFVFSDYFLFFLINSTVSGQEKVKDVKS